jgi:hypothetical protein
MRRRELLLLLAIACFAVGTIILLSARAGDPDARTFFAKFWAKNAGTIQIGYVNLSPVSAPTPSPTSEPAPTPTASPSPTPYPTATPNSNTSPTPWPSSSPTTSPSPTMSPSPSSTPTPSPTATPGPSPSPTPTPSPTPPPSDELKLVAYAGSPLVPGSQTLDSINCDDFGLLYRGQSTTYAVYFRNEGDIPFTLYLSTSDWIFRDSAGRLLSQDHVQYFAVTWDYDNSVIFSGEIKLVTFTLAISPSLVDVSTFSCNIVVTAVQ